MSLFRLLRVLSCAILVVADFGPYIRDPFFDAGGYGEWPVERFVSTEVVSPRLNIISSSPECDTSLYTAISPRGEAVEEIGQLSLILLDAKGSLVYTATGFDRIYNLMVQNYLGESFLTFWGGNDGVGGHGEGFYYMLDSQYQVRYKLDAVGGFHADLHEFRITDQGTYLATVYPKTVIDFSDWHEGVLGYIWDGVFQEIDLATGDLLFEWRASDHFTTTDGFREPDDSEGTEEKPFDWFHINSIEKDDKGNYLISARFVSCLTYISGQTGEILWILGGKRNMFQDISDGKATNMRFQHDARWQDDYTTITIFDNGCNDEAVFWHDTRGVKIKVDSEKRTAEMITEYNNPHHFHSMSQGSVQLLPNGNVLVGYGNSGAWTEFSSEGEPLCDVHMGPERSFGTGVVESYRTLKYEWHGDPPWPPDIQALNDGLATRIFVSWNGATEVVTWVLQGAEDPDAGDDAFVALEYILKAGFETQFLVGASHPRYLRVVARNIDGESIGMTPLADTVEQMIFGNRPISPNGDRSMSVVLLICSLAVFGVVVAWREWTPSHPWHKRQPGKEFGEFSTAHRGVSTMKTIIQWPVSLVRGR